MAVAETYIGETWHRGDEATAYMRAIDRQWEGAVEGDEARRLIALAASDVQRKATNNAPTIKDRHDAS